MQEHYLSDGDRNTSFFHALLTVRRQKMAITITRSFGNITSDPHEIGELAAQHITQLFTTSQYQLSEELFQGVQATITDTDNDGLTYLLSIQKVRNAVVSFMAMVHGFFMGDYLTRQASSTLVILIPKVERPTGFADMRSISLGTFASKVISKIIANILASLLPRIIDDHQSGFVKGRSIHESITLA